ncbi:MAG: hypothetical protein ACYDAQ_05810 [Mycobacteriales bacterium]
MAALVVALAVLLPVRTEFRAPVSPQDEGLLLVYPSQILRGAVPNRSFESVYGEASLLAAAGAFEVGGYSVAAERSVGLFYEVLPVGALAMLVGRRRGPWLGCLAGVTAAALVDHVP